MPAANKGTPHTQALPSTISVAKAKANFSSVLNGVEKKHVPMTILRRGVPIAQIIPFPGRSKEDFLGSMEGTGEILGDIVNPYMEEWTVSEAGSTGGDE